MGDLIIKPASGGVLKLQDAGSTDRITVTDGGTTVLNEDGGAAALTINTDGSAAFAEILQFTSSSTSMQHDEKVLDANDTDPADMIIASGGSGRGSFAIVWGYSYSGDQRWSDYVLVGRTTVQVESSFSFLGTPPTRTYTCTNFTVLNLVHTAETSATISVVQFYH